MQNMLAALAPLIIGIRRQAVPPLRFGAQQLHRMHVLVMNPHQRFEVPSPSDELEQVLPRLSCWPAQAQARPVLGEILRGEQGEWYERIGNRIRPLRRLVSGPNGEVLEIPNGTANRIARPETADEDVSEDESGAEESSATQRRQAPECAAFRSLLAETGAWRVLTFGSFKPLLAHQLSQPARLRDSHRLPCHIEVFEAIAPQRIDALARAILGDAAGPTDLQPLTPALVAQFELASLLPAPSRVPPFSAGQELVRAGQRFFRLTIANDPTAQPAPTTATSVTSATQPDSTQTPPQAAGPARATSIPVPLLRPWEFCRSREEAISKLLPTGSWWARFTRPLRRFIHRTAFQRWQLLLSGRSADEQLWCVPPPHGWLGDAWLRNWARHTLEFAGYDSAVMLSEWEIFWGRKMPS